VVEIGLSPRPTPRATGIRGWLAAIGNPVGEGLATEARDRVFDLAVELLEPSLRDHAGNWSADYVRLRFSAVLTGG
ncbi:MAG: SAM-dependent methyltransferase, partial [Rhodospirillales bacterium]